MKATSFQAVPGAPARPAAVLAKPAHPTRAANKCVDCAHRLLQRDDWCNHPSIEVDLVTGLPTQSCVQVRVTVCGPEGKLFERRP